MRRISMMGLTAMLVLSLTPTLLAQDQQPAITQSWFKMFFIAGGDPVRLVVVWIAVAMSAASFALMIRFGLQYRRGMLIPDQTREQVKSLIDQKKYREAIDYANNDPSYLGQLVSTALSEASNGYGAMEHALDASSEVQVARMLRPVEYLNIMGNIAPMMGLLGTVYGMIVAFEQFVSAGARPDPSQLAGGISTALVTTFWGLVVAIPALTAYAVIRNKLDGLTAQGLTVAEQLIQPFKPGSRRERKNTNRDANRNLGELTDAQADKVRPPIARPRATPRPEMPAAE